MMDGNKLFESLDKVLDFSSDLIIRSLKDKKPEKSQINEVKQYCDVLAEAGVFPFETNCNDEDLFKQIQEFATHVNG